ncbi:hypothetical protein HN51_053618 [Arachis hypogaea]|uniref:Pentatricopeptide repeat-containing protein n=1 Tax=Arachis hypogaea TaxID=3818 RepID=A0A444XD41_ARAHY|nr:pentatricopeptide repeat-containing protein At4g26680, mitochondrial [Arachis ipaensis]XP_025674760.1 pentatricopeptide repeat-containing protein At4g26680, mitochondrial [Arachis hypogaea]QHN76001.1 Pentatricopeptide repeat-containing protein [Arachis hypogaea]RYQ87510.1 hypothetical protein Ahy_B09g095031 isoform A [Arachis hypogaea]RYQ87511.1 hypothetical protein Ahy_B09g095031 isoform B [Arachis hypogaea]
MATPIGKGNCSLNLFLRNWRNFCFHFHRFSTSSIESSSPLPFKSITSTIRTKPSKRIPNNSSFFIPIPHQTIPQAKGQDLDFINVSHSHIIHSQWENLQPFSHPLTPFRVKHILLKLKNDAVLSLKFSNWVQNQNPSCHSLETHAILLHTLAKNRNFRAIQTLLKRIIADSGALDLDLPSKLFESLLCSYRLCDSTPLVFDALFKTFAHLNKIRNATNTFCRMKEYGFFPTVESCNAFMSSLIHLQRPEVALLFYCEMRRSCVSINVYTVNMVICAYCKLGELQKGFEVLEKMRDMGLSPNVVSFNALISGYCNKGMVSLALKVKSLMEHNGVQPNVVTFNTIINGFCKERKLHEANKVFNEMKGCNVASNIVTYNTLINGYSSVGNSEMGTRLYEEMRRDGIKADILTYNALILGLCKEGKTKKAAYLVKELDKENLVPNASTFSALITGQCARKNSERAFLIYRSMIRSGCNPNEHTFKMLMSAFLHNEDFEGAVQVLRDMLGRSMAPDSLVLSELCGGLCRCGRNQLASTLCSEMENKHLLPEGFDKGQITIDHPENETKN